MPSFTKVVWETLLEPVVQDSHKCFFKKSDDVASNEEREDVRSTKHIYISPALYATPLPTPIPDCTSDPSSPSPYIVNHKRRGGKVFSLRSDGSDEKKLESENDAVNVVEESFDQEFLGQEEIVLERNEVYAIEDELFDSRCEQVGTSSCSEVDDCGKQIDNQSLVSYQGEFFDAIEELSMDGSTSSISFSYVPKLESELRFSRISLLEEIERRKNAEDALNRMYKQWERLSTMVSEAGVSFPPLTDASSFKFDESSLEQLHQEIVVARFVSEAIGHGMARAKAEVAAEEMIQSKDHEITRLRDRLQYYEAVNREMCLRNQENMELARNQRQRKRIQRRWLWWGCVGLVVSAGASAIGYSYLPQPQDRINSTE
ncbi:uncharacterized protein LOC124945526 [Impatiens glandulifera]|uniref:uncharacterized protein LOC124945526 n=1 Tax=Impatiens glandulifera TaxID=253017 RepID=UPI001FB0A0FD|nr:uncharacterized protein LOC124945526 [Impatiens glandulifera]